MTCTTLLRQLTAGRSKMDKTDGFILITAIALLIFQISVFGVFAAVGVTVLWVLWLVAVGTMAAREAYHVSED